MEYKLKGTLHNKQWFLENGWIDIEIENAIMNENGDEIYDNEFESVILLKEIKPETSHFEFDLQCKSKLYYKKEWFKTLDVINSTSDLLLHSDLVYICYLMKTGEKIYEIKKDRFTGQSDVIDEKTFKNRYKNINT